DGAVSRGDVQVEQTASRDDRNGGVRDLAVRVRHVENLQRLAQRQNSSERLVRDGAVSRGDVQVEQAASRDDRNGGVRDLAVRVRHVENLQRLAQRQNRSARLVRDGAVSRGDVQVEQAASRDDRNGGVRDLAVRVRHVENL